LFGITGVVGLLLTFLWIATDHQAAAKNFNLLWAIPTHLVAAILVFRNTKWLGDYFLLTASIAMALLITWKFLPQQLNVSLVPIVIMLGLRGFCQYKLRRK
jgi:hypothetical protein